MRAMVQWWLVVVLAYCLPGLIAAVEAEAADAPAEQTAPQPAPTNSSPAEVAAEEPPAGEQPVVPLPDYQSVTIANDQAILELSSEQGAIKFFRLRGVHPIQIPDHYIDDGKQAKDPDSHLAVMGAHYTGGPLHNWLRGLGLGQVGPQKNRGHSWEVHEKADDHVTFHHFSEATGLDYYLRYVLRSDRPTADITLLVENASETPAELAPILYPINGVHQDVGRNESWHLTYAEHRGGAGGDLVRRDAFPPPGKKSETAQVGPDFDYIALKSRFFIAIWQPHSVDLGPEVSWQAVPERAPSPSVEESAGGGPGGGGPGGGPAGASPTTTSGDSGVPHQINFHAFGFEEGGGAGGRNRKQQAYLTASYSNDQGAPFRLQPGDKLRMGWEITISSMRAEDLAKLSPAEQRLEYTDAFHRFFRILSDILSGLLKILASIPGVGYGLGVILLTILIKLALYRTTYKQQKSMFAMQKLGPELKRIQEQYKSDPQTRNAKTMELWKKHGVNPLGGCLPIFIQMPIFIALYQSFSHVAELRGESFLWIPDLTLPDQVWYLGTVFGMAVTINVLPILYMAISLVMTFSNKPPASNSASPGGDQAAQMMKMMRWMPVLFGVIFYNMPSGLVLYFTMSALISTIEIKWIRHKLGINAASTAKA